MSSSGGASGPTRVSEYPTAPVGGSEAAEIAIFATCLSIFFLYHVYYYKRHVLLRHWWLSRAQKTLAMDLWTTAVESRILWTREMINQPQEGDSLLAVHTMRNIAIAASILVTGIAQMMARLFQLITSAPSMQQLDHYAASDPIAAASFAAPEVKVGIAAAVLIISFCAFAQCARLSVHLSFMFRIAPTTEGPLLEALRCELVALTHRVSVFFTVAIRLLYLFFILIAWCLGITAFLVFFVLIMTFVVVSDYVPARVSQEQFDRAEKAARRITRGENPENIFNVDISEDWSRNNGASNA